MPDLLLLAALAAAWWIPTFTALADLQARERLPRVQVWRWTAVLCVPVAGAAWYFVRGRPQLDAAGFQRG